MNKIEKRNRYSLKVDINTGLRIFRRPFFVERCTKFCVSYLQTVVLLYDRKKRKAPKTLYFRGNKKEQVMGIEPTYSAWKADVLPLNHTCIIITTRGDRIRTCDPLVPNQVL